MLHALVLCSIGCSDATTGPVIDSDPAPVALEVLPDILHLRPGETAQLRATLRDHTGKVVQGGAISWSTSDSATATVSSTGLVLAVSSGSAKVSAGHPGKGVGKGLLKKIPVTVGEAQSDTTSGSPADTTSSSPADTTSGSPADTTSGGDDTGGPTPTDTTLAGYHVSTEGSDGRSCLEARNSATPKRTIQAGVRCATQPGDVVLIRGGSYVETVSNGWHSGAPGMPITITSFPGETVVWRASSTDPASFRGAVFVDDRSYIRLERLVFDGTVTQRAVMFRNSSGDKNALQVVGIEIVNNVFRHNGSRELRTMALSAVSLGSASVGETSILIEGNTFDGNYGHDVFFGATTDGIIRNNVMKNGRTGTTPAPFAGDFHGGIHFGQERAGFHTARNLIEGNEIHSFDDPSSNYRPVGIKFDVNADDNDVQFNVIHDIPQGTGIIFESRCDRNVARFNVIYRVGHLRQGGQPSAIRFGSGPTRTAIGNRAINNTIFDVFFGIFLSNAGNSVVKNNIVMKTGAAAVAVNPESVTAGGNVFRNNDYFRPGSSLIGRWNETGNSPNLTFSEWISRSGDQNSISVDPLFVSEAAGSEDFHLKATSPARGAGEGGSDIGAYP